MLTLLRSPMSTEVLWLAALCILDMATSALLFQQNLAIELNPLLRPYAQAGALPFFAAKSLTFFPALLYLEWLRRRRPEVALPLARWACLLYAGIYGFGL